MRVLIIDDDEMVANALSSFLKHSLEFDTETVNNAHEALNLISHHSFELIICDLKMPDMDGFTLFEKAKLISAESFGFILISGFFTDKNLAFAYEQGIEFCVKKPVKISQLISVIHQITHQRNMRYANVN